MPEEVDLAAYADKLIDRFTDPSLKHQTWQVAMDYREPIRLLRPYKSGVTHETISLRRLFITQ